MPGKNTIQKNLSDLATGLYTITLMMNGEKVAESVWVE